MGNSQVRDISSKKQISDLPRVREKIRGGGSIGSVGVIGEAKVRVRGAKEDRK